MNEKFTYKESTFIQLKNGLPNCKYIVSEKVKPRYVENNYFEEITFCI